MIRFGWRPLSQQQSLIIIVLILTTFITTLLIGNTHCKSDKSSTSSTEHPILYRFGVLIISVIIIVGGWYIIVKCFLIRFKIVRELLGLEQKKPTKVVVKKTPRVASISVDEE